MSLPMVQRRLFLKNTACLAAMAAGLPVSAAEEDSLSIQRLNWAGVRFATGDIDLLVDGVLTDIWEGDSPYPLVQPTFESRRRYALITHNHSDHFDSEGLKTFLGERGRVICDERIAAYVASQGLKIITAPLYTPIERGPFTLVPLPAVDGLGGEQVSWLISVGGQRYIHCGDTLWHGAWRTWGRLFGPFEAAFLPMNGARQVAQPESEIPLSLTPAQAVDAAVLLRAKRLVPIHYGYHVAGAYEEFPDAMATLRREAERREVRLQVMTPGDWLDGAGM